MSSGFVSGGTIDKPAERDDAWRQAQQELAESRARKEEAAQNDGKSLYEVLQANKGNYYWLLLFDRPRYLIRM
jgi:hypothetical protein